MSSIWNSKAITLTKILKAQRGIKWSDLADAINQVDPDNELTTQNPPNAINRGSYNTRLLLKISEASGYGIAFKKDG